MELSSKIKGLKFMKRKEDAAARREAETHAQATLGAQGHWRLPDAPAAVSSGLPVRVEYVQSESGGARRVFGSSNVASVPNASSVPSAVKRPHPSE